MRTPVAMLVFNRPVHTARVFDAVRAARPRELFVVADGPREGRAGEAEASRATRTVFEGVDWPCEVVRIFSEGNLGCGKRIGTGISEVFEKVERCIFLEDDCLPDPTFFPFCEELLDRYADDERVMAVSGDGFTSSVGGMTFAESYYFTRFVHVWGWATWRRAWRHFDLSMRRWPGLRDGGWLRGFLKSGDATRFWHEYFEDCFAGRVDTWDLPWVFSCWAAREGGGLSICPDRNLVSNIGFDGTGAHVGKTSRFANLERKAVDFPLRHPAGVERNEDADRWTQRHMFSGSLRQRWRRLKRSLR